MGRPNRVLKACALAIAVICVACQTDPTGGHRPPALAASVPAFNGASRSAVRDDVSLSWHPGCPVSWSKLAVITVSYWGYDGQRHRGGLVVRDSAAGLLLTVFESLYRQRFQIERIHPVDVYGADDDRSMKANNTSAFNCRTVASSGSVWSQHAYGLAVDINPMQNPYIDGTTFDPPGGEHWSNRSDAVPGMAVEGGPLVGAFNAIGWGWGGHWRNTKDYQHFSESGR